MSKTGWTVKEAEMALKAQDEVMCVSLHQQRRQWSITLHEWDGFKGPLELEDGSPVLFDSADAAIAEATRLGFAATSLVGQGKPPTFLDRRAKNNFRLVISPRGVITPALSSAAILPLEI